MCKTRLQEFHTMCHGSISRKQSEIKYNTKYIKTLHTIDNSLERTVSAFYRSNILGVMKSISKLCQKNDIIEVYNKITTKLSSHFHILTQDKIQEQAKDVDVKDDQQLDSFLQRVIVRIHHNISKRNIN